MKGFFAVAQREFVEHRRFLAAAGFVGLWPFLMPLLSGGGSESPSVLRAGAALYCSLVMTVSLSLMLGGSVFARDLSERRLGFYFSRPISSWAIWGGKLAGALLLTFSAGALTLAPTLLIGDRVEEFTPFGELRPAVIALAWLGMLLLLLLAAHIVSTMIRSRSLWLALDLAGIVLAAVLVLRLRDQLLLENVGHWWIQSRGWLFAALLLALLVATAVQLVRGRTDLRNSHRWLSVTLSSLLLLLSLAATAVVSRLLAAAPGDLVEIEELTPAPRGRWIGLSGKAAHSSGFHPSFVLDTASGRFRRIRLSFFSTPPSIRFSNDGRWAAWAEADSLTDHFLARLDLTRPDAEPVRVPVGSIVRAFAFSPEGDRIAVLLQDRLLLEETATGRLIRSFPQSSLDPRHYGSGESLYFLGPERLRLYLCELETARSGPDLWVVQKRAISEIDLTTGRIEKTGKLATEPWYSMSPDGKLLLVSGDLDHLYDARTGTPLVSLLPESWSRSTAGFLPDGRIAQILTEGERQELRIYDREAKAELRRFALPSGRNLYLGAQPAPGLLTLASRKADPKDWQSLLLDLETGHVRDLGFGLLPAGNLSLPAGSFGSTLFFREGNRLVSIDSKTGRQTAVSLGS